MSNKNFSISELVKRILDGLVDPKTLSKVVLRKCAVQLRNMGYSSAEIADIFKVDKRSIQRYVKEYRESLWMELGEHFQKDLMGEIVNDMRLQCQHLWKLIYSGELSPGEKVKTVCAIHQILINKINLLERLGYLQESKARDEVNTAFDMAVEKREQQEANAIKFLHDKRLTPEQINYLKDYYMGEMHIYPHKKEDIVKRLKIIIEMLADENEILEKRRLQKLKDVTGSSRLYCKVFVVNKLCNN